MIVLFLLKYPTHLNHHENFLVISDISLCQAVWKHWQMESNLFDIYILSLHLLYYRYMEFILFVATNKATETNLKKKTIINDIWSIWRALSETAICYWVENYFQHSIDNAIGIIYQCHYSCILLWNMCCVCGSVELRVVKIARKSECVTLWLSFLTQNAIW